MIKNNKINNLVKISICTLLIILSFIIGNVYGESNCNIGLKISNTKVKTNEEFTVEVNATDIQSTLGIMAFGATIEYDKEILSIEKLEGLNDWETPINGMSFNNETGKIAITKNGFGKEDEAIIKITFRVNKGSKKNQTITLKEITVSDGTALIKPNEVSQKITVKGNNFIRNIIIIIIVIVIILFIINKKSRNGKK